MPLQDSDNFIVGRGTDSYKITYQDLKDDLNYVPPPVLNLEVGKGSISPSVNLEEGDTLTGSATVTDAENPVVVHVWELDGVEVQRGSEATYVADAGSVRYRKEVTDDNNQSPVIGEWSEAVTVEEAFDPTKPNAVMHGLRFDSERQTYMQRTASGTGLPDTTVSFWVKPQGKHITCYSRAEVTDITADADDRMMIYFDKNNKFRLDNTQVSLISKDALTANTWHHCVFKYLASSNTFEMYVNGVDAEPSFNGTWDSDYSTASFPGAFVGGSPTQDGQDPLYADGYLSDLYVVEQALEPTAFGKSFDGKWGPLDSTEVLENIGYKESPSDAAPNYAEKWSDSLSVSAGSFQSPATNAFNGDLNSSAVGDNGNSSIIFTTSSFSSGPYDIEVTADNSHTVTVDGADTTKVGDSGNVTFSITVDNFTNITVTSFGSKPDLAGIKVNGRILIDGPADNSQVWSNGTITGLQPRSSNPITNGFDGDLSTEFESVNESDGSKGVGDFMASITLPAPVTVQNTVEIFANGQLGARRFYLNNDSVNWKEPQSEGETLVFNFTGQLEKINVAAGSIYTPDISNSGKPASSFRFKAIKVDGKLLIDSPPAWNTSQVWSENSSGNLFNNDPVSLAFDGNLSTQITSGTVDCVIDLGEVPGTKFELYGGSGESHSLGLQPYILVNGTQATLGSVLENDWGDVTSLITDGKLNTITLSASANNLYANLGAVRVDGEILVDGGSFGANGFYLPFDPETEGLTGQTWSDDVDTESFTVEANRGPDKGFDGDLSTSCAVNANNDVYYISLKDDSFANQKVEVYTSNPDQDGDRYISLNGSSFDISRNFKDWLDIGNATSDGTATIGIGSNDDTMRTIFYAVRIGGRILIDNQSYSGIGNDASGQGNNFADENFNVFDDAADAIGDWSVYWSNPPTDSTNRPKWDSFDGDVTTFTGCNRDETNQWIPPGGLTVNNSITIWTNSGSGSRNAEEEIEFIFNDLTVQRTQIKDESETIEGNVRKWTRTVSNPVTLQKISQNRSDTGNGICLSKLEIDGKVFIEGSFIASVGVDTVLDTPMDNYAVLETGKNGNLVATANGTNLTYVGEAGTDYYYEADGEADIHTGGSAFSSTNGKVYNFGQQPFAVALDDSRDWSGDFTTGTYDANLPASNSFNGIIASGQIVDASYSTGASGQTAGFDFTSIPGGGISFAESIQVYVFRNIDADPIFINGQEETDFVKRESSQGPQVKTYTAASPLPDGTTVLKTFSAFRKDTTSTGVGLVALVVDGKLLVDSNEGLSAAKNNLLYQTWEQYARTSLGYALDRIAKLEQLRLEDAETIANLRILIDGALSRISSIESDEINDDAVDNSLITLVGSLSSQITTWTQRIEQAESALSSVADRVTTLEL